MNWDERLTLPEMLAASVEAVPDKVCLYLEGVELTYADLERGSNAYANRYMELGIGKGDAVACLMETAPEHAYSLFACMKLGAVHVPIEDALNLPAADVQRVLSLDEALEKLASMNPRHARVAECRLFGGMTAEETAAALEVSPTTIRRDWNLVRLWLGRELGEPA